MLSVRFLVVDGFPGGPSGCSLGFFKVRGDYDKSLHVRVDLPLKVHTCEVGMQPGRWDKCQSHLRVSQVTDTEGSRAGMLVTWVSEKSPHIILCFQGRRGFFFLHFFHDLLGSCALWVPGYPVSFVGDAAWQSLPFMVSTVTCWGAGTLAYVKHYSKQ